MPALAAEARFAEALAAGRPRDAAAGGSAIGPHRSDLTVSDRRRGVPATRCSTGEQKTLLLAIVLAEANLVASHRGLPPLLLLDEVTAHLDENRRTALCQRLLAHGAQVWLTGTEPALFRALKGRACVLAVADGQARLEE
jgi:DNA replication and repair protein RecF